MMKRVTSFVRFPRNVDILHIGARMKKSAYGLNDAPRRWWQVVDKALVSVVWYLLEQTVAHISCMAKRSLRIQ